MDKKKILNFLNSSSLMFGVPPEETDFEVLSTGSPSLDISTDIGGIPSGRITTIFGPFSSGKTTLAMHIAKNALELGKSVLFIDMEATFSGGYFKEILGKISDENFALYVPESGEDAMNTIETSVNEGLFNVIILDSVGSLFTKEEREKSAGDRSIAQIARLLSRSLRVIMPPLKEHDIYLILLNQVRNNINSPFVEHTMPGGNVLSHLSSMIIKLTRHSKIKYRDEDIGHWVKARIEKSKVGRPYRTCYIPVISGKGIDKEMDLIEFASSMGVGTKVKAYFHFEIDGELFKLGKGLISAAEMLREDPELYNKIFDLCKRIYITKGGYGHGTA